MQKLKILIQKLLNTWFGFINRLTLLIQKIIIYLRVYNILMFFKHTFHLFLGSSVIFTLFYLRLVPRISRDLYENMTEKQVFFTCLTIVCIIFNIYNTLKIIGIIPVKEPSGYTKIVIDAFEIFADYIRFTLVNLYSFFWYVLEKLYKKLSKDEDSLEYFVTHPVVKPFTTKENIYKYFYVLFILKYLPRTILVTVFFIEVMFYNHLHWTFYCLPYLLLRLLEPFFCFLLTRFRELYIEGVASFLDFQKKEDQEKISVSVKPDVDENNLPYGAKNYKDYIENHFYVLCKIPHCLARYREWQYDEIYAYHITLILQFVRLSIYLFILFFGIT